jgi:hypothetical protein
VDQDWDARVARHLEDRRRGRVGELELLGAGVQLDPAGALGQAALGLRDRILLGVEPAVRDQPTVADPSPFEHAIVGYAVGGMALGIVEGKHHRARGRADLVERRQERVGVEPCRSAARDRSDFVAHSPAPDHLSGDLGQLLDVGLGAGGDLAVDDLLGHAAAERDLDLRLEVLARVRDAIAVGGRQGHPERLRGG